MLTLDSAAGIRYRTQRRDGLGLIAGIAPDCWGYGPSAGNGACPYFDPQGVQPTDATGGIYQDPTTGYLYLIY